MSSEAEVEAALAQGNAARATAPTAANTCSSRSHAICQLQLVRLASEARLRLRHLREGIEDGLLAPAAGPASGPAHPTALAGAQPPHAPPHAAGGGGSSNDPIAV